MRRARPQQLSVRRDHDVVAPLGERTLQDQAGGGVIFGDEHFHRPDVAFDHSKEDRESLPDPHDSCPQVLHGLLGGGGFKLGSGRPQGFGPHGAGGTLETMRLPLDLHQVILFTRVDKGTQLSRDVTSEQGQDVADQRLVCSEEAAQHIGVEVWFTRGAHGFNLAGCDRAWSFRSRADRGTRCRVGPAGYHTGQLLQAEWLGEVVVHAGRDALLPITSHGMRGESHDWHPSVAYAGLWTPDDARRLQSIHLRHLDIHEDQIIRRLQ